jgi:dihydrofolate reductase
VRQRSVCSILCTSCQINGQGALEVRIGLPSISYIVARSSPDCIIGRNNQLPWHLRTDLRRFKAYTSGHSIIMGRKTYRSIGHPLPGRVNIVLSRRSEIDIQNSFWHHDDTMLLWAENRVSALFFADVMSIAKGKSDFFVIGGAEMYRIFEDLFNKMYLTEVITGAALKREETDAVFEFRVDYRRWKTLETINVPAGPHDDFPSKFTVLERKTSSVRHIEVKDYYTEAESKKKWVQEQLDSFQQFKNTGPIKPFRVPDQYELFEERTQRP